MPPGPLFLLLPPPPTYLLRNVFLTYLKRPGASDGMTGRTSPIPPGGPPLPSFGRPTASSQGRASGPPPKPHTLQVAPTKGAPSMRYLCGEPSCQHRSASVLDARGHHQASPFKSHLLTDCVPTGTTPFTTLPPWPTTWICNTMSIQVQS